MSYQPGNTDRAPLSQNHQQPAQQRQQESYDTMRLPRASVSMQIPLWGLVTALAGLVWLLMNMYFTTNQTSKDVTDLQITVKAGNTQTTTLAGAQALMQFRLENAESELRVIRQALDKTATQAAARAAAEATPPRRAQ